MHLAITGFNPILLWLVFYATRANFAANNSLHSPV
ncbi:hypothetical protein D0784_13290 [Vibrio campbellii]|nr:hypothetical protein C1N50_03190 [Vibrio campbellii]AUW04048.1 hypothetical protein C1N51_10255 [Vibrio campbellii]AYO10316.1 hypothetical protein D0784_13290 [Vibrio campbellii]